MDLGRVTGPMEHRLPGYMSTAPRGWRLSGDGGTTDADGRYELQVAPGDHRIQSLRSSPYLDEYYNDEATAEHLDLVTIGTADVTGTRRRTDGRCNDQRAGHR